MLPFPPHYEQSRAEDFSYVPDQLPLLQLAADWRRAHRIAPAADDARRVHLLLIDVQKDFCFPQGSLYVGGRSGRGALEDNRRTTEFIYRNLSKITEITTTLDTHSAQQIFFPSFWRDRAGRAPAPHREVTLAEIERGDLRPDPALAGWLCGGDVGFLEAHVRHYCRELERAGKYRLYLWPAHCILGSAGHALAGAVHEARMFHAYARCAQSWCETKGGHPLTENYSALRPEVVVRADGAPLAERNDALLARLRAAEVLVVAGQAASHCVLNTMDDLLEELDESLAARVHLLTDCMSAVAVPDGRGGFLADFTPQVDAALRRWQGRGVRLVRSTDGFLD